MDVEVGLLVESATADVAFEGQFTAMNAHVLVVVDRLGELLIAVLALETGVLVREHMHPDLGHNLVRQTDVKPYSGSKCFKKRKL